jgi:cell division protein FtsZ
MTLHEISEASTLIQEAAHEEANIIFGAVIDESMSETIRVTVIATGFDQARVSFPESAHGFANIPQQGGQFMPPNLTGQAQAQIPQQAFGGMNSQRPQQGFPQNIPAVNPYDVRNQGQAPAQHQQGQFGQSNNQPNHFQRPQFGRDMQQANYNTPGMSNQIPHSNRPNQQQELGGSHSGAASGMFRTVPQTENRTAPTNSSHLQGNSKSHDNQMTSSWTNQQQSQQNAANQKNEGSSDLEDLTKWTFDMANQQHSAKSNDPKVMGASTKHEENHEDAAESALKLAKELSDIEIDDSDFETPAFMRRKDDSHRNA